jgi:cellulose synthase operon protein YhjQ
MWKSVNNTESSATEAQAGKADATRAAHGQEASRWFVLKGMLGGAEAPEKTADQAQPGEVPVLEVFSLAGGVGKTSLVATLGRALSARGERVLLVEATFLGSLQYFFGATDSRPGAVRTFRPPASSSDAPIQLATVDPDALLVESTVQGSLATDVQRWAQGASRVIVDVATGATAIARGLMQKSTVILVPLIPDVHAVVTAASINAFFQHTSGVQGGRSEVYYLLNQFDSSLPLHVDLREILREKLGDRLLPFTLPRTPAIGEALAEGMTIMDYAPDSPAAEDFLGLANWLDDVLAPADQNRRGIRWSER